MSDVLQLDRPTLAVPGDSLGSSERGQITLHSGLALKMRDGKPVLPEFSSTDRMRLAAKRAFDIAVSTFLLIFLAPFLVLVAVAVRSTSTGPALLRQVREGRDGKPISIYKFRTMYFERCDFSGVCQTVRNDPRITPLGRFLRRFNIDELPQLIDVMAGRMSLVGARPHVYGQLAASMPYRELVPYYGDRHKLKPGLTGWAQANGLRGPTDDPARARARVDHDLAYIANFSLWLDLKILFLTVVRELRHARGS